MPSDPLLCRSPVVTFVTGYTLAVDSPTVVGVFVTVMVVVVHHVIFMGKQSTTFTFVVFVVYDFLCL